MSDHTQKLKDSVLTPKTDFPMRAGLTTRETETLTKWYQPQPDGSKDLYRAIQKRRADAPLYVLHDGPPYANGDAHTGTGMNKILKDFVVKYQTMMGHRCPYIPGWDCHGLPIEHKVLEKLGGKKPEEMSALDVREQCLEFANSFIDRQREQFKRTLTMGRWEEPYLTINPVYEGAVLDCFADLMRKGYVSRSRKPVHWSWAARSALAEAELEYENRKDPSIYVKFEMRFDWDSENDDTWRFGDLPDSFFEHFLPEGQSKPSGDDQRANIASRIHAAKNRLKVIQEKLGGKKASFVIWTTTPWTLPANLAIAVSKDAEYGFYENNGEYLVLACDLAASVFEKAGYGELPAPALRLTGGDILGLTYQQPLWKTTCMLFPADYVTLEDGTGLVHTAPGHGAEDFGLGAEYGLPSVCPVDERGCYYEISRLREELGLGEDWQDSEGWLEQCAGQHILKANKFIIKRLEESGAMVHWYEFEHSYPHCWRTHQPVIFRATEQWFVRIDHTPEGEERPLRQQLGSEVENTNWFPAWGEKRISGMVGNRPDWCISRQRYWGIPIPAFLDEESGKTCADSVVAQRIADLVREHGSNVWFDDAEWPIEKLLPDEFRPDEFKGKALTKMNDIFDVWFESGASHRGVVLAESELQDDAESFRPADLYLEGDDQHRGWFQVSLILGTATQGVSPYKNCLTSAFVVDEKGQKGSKSKGNIFAIDEGCNQIGADLFRLYFASVDTSSPIPVTMDLVKEKSSSNYRTLRNTIRVLLGNLADFDPGKDCVDDLMEIDRWALSRLSACIVDVQEAMARFEFHVATRRIVDFCNLELSAFYIDVTKDRLYCDGPASKQRRSGQTTIYRLASALIRMIAPICAHTAEEAWSHLPGNPDELWSVHLANYPQAECYPRDEALEESFATLLKVKEDVDRILDRKRKDKSLKKSTSASVEIHTSDNALLELMAAHFACGGKSSEKTPLYTILGVSDALVVGDAPEGGEAAETHEGMTILVEASTHHRCERCWNHWESVSERPAHDNAALCDRCDNVISA